MSTMTITIKHYNFYTELRNNRLKWSMCMSDYWSILTKIHSWLIGSSMVAILQVNGWFSNLGYVIAFNVVNMTHTTHYHSLLRSEFVTPSLKSYDRFISAQYLFAEIELMHVFMITWYLFSLFYRVSFDLIDLRKMIFNSILFSLFSSLPDSLSLSLSFWLWVFFFLFECICQRLVLVDALSDK